MRFYEESEPETGVNRLDLFKKIIRDKIISVFDGDQKIKETNILREIISELNKVDGSTPATNKDDINQASFLFYTADGSSIYRYKNPAQFEHIFIKDNKGNYAFGCYVGWVHNNGLKRKVEQIKIKYGRKY